ncbi:GtrA family protein [Clostridium beijerinckii]|uniref:Flippase GtrA n=1 Tax=Clostridium beijerinckii TaxID=1520 RepID=A0A9Q5D1Q2_CLOBE|nr:GtrA family protein [Clostridium beijerinckii]MBA2884234.1 putative flippase GtrA [Clostridium beijerinckii]MBA2898303.1 putative flippase GtrA [Clostridium beijerinckii]MBA2908911.1 putative flippase GtrA [Clostridium beijerinckii]MBA9012754.1 putative flippase GtrA [Clostridium beijerinckii]MBC2416640.1 GtrA family protein [Clostridium beijerinckii]
MNKIKRILNSEGIKYIIFGVLTTLVNILTYLVLSKIGILYVMSNSVAFILSIIFAFITNKIYVFNSKTLEIRNLIREGITFLCSRLATFVIDTALMILLIGILSINDFIAKCMVNIVVIIVNYILSKFIVFKDIK